MKKVFVLFCVLMPIMVSARFDSTFVKKAELELQKDFTQLNQKKTFEEQNKLNANVLNIFKKTLLDPLSFTYPFDSLKHIGKITSPNEQIRIYTWNVPYEDGSHGLNGIIQYKIDKDSLNFIVLNDQSLDIENPENVLLTPKKWFGALYYEVVEQKMDKQTYYFLMGYNPWSLFSNKKVIEVFYFDEYGIPFLGKPLFLMNNKLLSRVVFEYNERATMSLHYNNDVEMIVFHHLVPIDYKYEGNPTFYGPDFSFDGLKFEEGVWNFHENVDVRNKNY